ncbi:MAG: hypothetical protein HKN83_01595 [Gammaproteobacteria bacterium]|nr:hypothetical protein [Gammaproteobacteria bacterium]
MKTIKAIAFSCMVLLTLTAGKCFVVSSFDSSHDDDDDEGLTIVVTNAETANSEVVQSLNQTFAVAEIASQSAQYVNDIYLSDPLSISCNNAEGVIKLMVNDEDHSNRISIGDDLFLSYTNCNVNDMDANGELEITMLDAKGIDIGRFDSGTDWSCDLSVKATSFQVSANNNTFSVNGDLEIALQFNATSAILKSKIVNNSLVLESEFQRVLSEMEISQFINLAVVPSGYSLSIDSLDLSSNALNGKVSVVTNLVPLSGMEWLKPSEYFVELQAPESGALYITGKNSNAEVLISSSELVSINIDADGDSILEAEIYSIWPQI